MTPAIGSASLRVDLGPQEPSAAAYFSLATHPAAASMPHAAAASRHSRRSGPAAASARDAPRTVRPCRPWSAESAERNVAKQKQAMRGEQACGEDPTRSEGAGGFRS